MIFPAGLLQRLKACRTCNTGTPDTSQGLHKMQLNNCGEEEAFLPAAWAFYLWVLVMDLSIFFLSSRHTNWFLLLFCFCFCFCICCMKKVIALFLEGSGRGKMKFLVSNRIDRGKVEFYLEGAHGTAVGTAAVYRQPLSGGQPASRKVRVF